MLHKIHQTAPWVFNPPFSNRTPLLLPIPSSRDHQVEVLQNFQTSRIFTRLIGFPTQKMNQGFGKPQEILAIHPIFHLTNRPQWSRGIPLQPVLFGPSMVHCTEMRVTQHANNPQMPCWDLVVPSFSSRILKPPRRFLPPEKKREPTHQNPSCL